MSTHTEKRRNIGLRLAAWVALTALVLSVPLIAMQFTSEVNWTAFDFVFAGAMIMGVGVTYELAAMKGNGAYRVAVGVALAAAFLIVWTTGAVGIIADEGHLGNLMYFGVLAVALGGAFVASAKPLGMARAMLFTAGATALVGAIAVGYRMGEPSEVLGATTVFTAMWLASAWLFRRAAA